MEPHPQGSQRDKGHFLAIFPMGGNSSPSWGCKPSVASGPLIPALFAPLSNPSPQHSGTGHEIVPTVIKAWGPCRWCQRVLLSLSLLPNH